MSLGRGHWLVRTAFVMLVSWIFAHSSLGTITHSKQRGEKKVKEQGGITGLLHTSITEHLKELPLCWKEVSLGCPHGSTQCL